VEFYIAIGQVLSRLR